MSQSPEGQLVDLREEVAKELEPGERVIWASRPDPSLYVRNEWTTAAFGLAIAVFTTFGVVTSVMGNGKARGGSWVPSLLIGLPIIGTGIGLLTLPFRMMFRADRCVYAVTDRRVIVRIAKAFGSFETQSFYPDRLTAMMKVERRDGSGDLIFEQFWRQRARVRQGFIGLRDVRVVEELIRKTLLSGTQG